MADSGDRKKGRAGQTLRKAPPATRRARSTSVARNLFSLDAAGDRAAKATISGDRTRGRKMAGLLRANPHYADVKSTVEQGFPEIQIRFDQGSRRRSG